MLYEERRRKTVFSWVYPLIGSIPPPIWHQEIRVIAILFNPTLSYLALLGFIYFTFSHFIFKEIKFDLIGNSIDGFPPINEYKSRRMVVLLQSYTMILHVNFINFIDKWFDYSILCFSVALAIVILQLLLFA